MTTKLFIENCDIYFEYRNDFYKTAYWQFGQILNALLDATDAMWEQNPFSNEIAPNHLFEVTADLRSGLRGCRRTYLTILISRSADAFGNTITDCRTVNANKMSLLWN
jgi:hypothetical protein